MKFKLNFDAMIFAGEVFQCVLCGPGDDFFTEKEKDVLNRLQSSQRHWWRNYYGAFLPTTLP